MPGDGNPRNKARFAYYARLSPAHKAIYRKSDAIGRIDLPDAASLSALVLAVDEALATGKRARVAKATTKLCDAIVEQLGVPRVKIHVREVRPAIDGGELHGLYTFSADGEPAKLEVWMRTAAHAKVVRFRTYLRTFLHEVCHHLDVTLLALTESFHTEGFFRRESSLVRQLLSPRKEKEKPKADARQLALFG